MMLLLRISIALIIGAYSLVACGDSGQNSDAPQKITSTHAAFETLDMVSFREFIHSDGVKIVEFGGKHCAPCNRMRERLLALQKEMPALRLGLVFWEDCPELFQDQGVTYIPAQAVFDEHGNETASHVGEWEVVEMKKAVTMKTAR